MVGSEESSGGGVSARVPGRSSRRNTRTHRWEGGKHTIFIVTQDFFKLCQVSILMCECYSTHTFYFAELCILDSEFD